MSSTSRSTLIRSTCSAVHRAPKGSNDLHQRKDRWKTRSQTTHHSSKNRLARLTCGQSVINVGTWTPEITDNFCVDTISDRRAQQSHSETDRVNGPPFMPQKKRKKQHSSQMSRVQALKRYPDVFSSDPPKPRHRSLCCTGSASIGPRRRLDEPHIEFIESLSKRLPVHAAGERAVPDTQDRNTWVRRIVVVREIFASGRCTTVAGAAPLVHGSIFVFFRWSMEDRVLPQMKVFILHFFCVWTVSR